MSEQPSSKQVRFAQGAAVSKREKPVFVPRPVEYDQGEMNQEAYALAMANQHKTWARRWLRRQRYL